MKKVIVLQHNGGQLGNQLWNFVSIYAYCLEKGFDCQNYSFFEYSKYFNIPVKNRLIDFLFFKTFNFYSSFLPFRVARKIIRTFYGAYVALIRLFKRNQIIYSGNSFQESKLEDFYFLPPTEVSKDKLAELEKEKNLKTIYFDGWLFRNPEGLLKYREKIIDYFQPKEIYRAKVNKFIENLKGKYSYLVGIHLRQMVPGDGKEVILEGAKMYISDSEIELVNKALKEYLEKFQKEASQVCFIVCSNKKVNISNFSKELNVVFADGNLIEDLYSLSKTDVILGCQSTFGTFAAYYGNIPHFTILKNGEIRETNIL